MVYKIRDITNGTVHTVSEMPRMVNGVWECGSERFTDPNGTLFESIGETNMQPNVSSFWFMFTSAERIAIRASTNATIEDFVGMLNDARTTTVDLTNSSVNEALQEMVTLNLITQDKMNQILIGVPA